jgi:hypothetical protein
VHCFHHLLTWYPCIRRLVGWCSRHSSYSNLDPMHSSPSNLVPMHSSSSNLVPLYSSSYDLLPLYSSSSSLVLLEFIILWPSTLSIHGLLTWHSFVTVACCSWYSSSYNRVLLVFIVIQSCAFGIHRHTIVCFWYSSSYNRVLLVFIVIQSCVLGIHCHTIVCFWYSSSNLVLVVIVVLVFTALSLSRVYEHCIVSNTVKPVYEVHSRELEMCSLWTVSLYLLFIHGKNETVICFI